MSSTWTIGRATLRSVIETDAGGVIQSIIPAATPDALSQITWLVPNFANSDGQLKAVVQCFLLEIDGQRVIIDTCVGNGKKREELADWNMLQTDFLDRLSAVGFSRESVDVVICTHLHFDHVGWNTLWASSLWTPTFPRARYVFVQEEYDYWKTRPEAEIEDDHAGFVDSVRPVVEAGLADLVSTTAEVVPGVNLIPTPGHTPHHVSVLIESDGDSALVTGDAMHHPCQIAHPDWGTISDTDPDLARSSREELLARFSASDTRVIGAHFAFPTGGLIRRVGDDFVFV